MRFANFNAERIIPSPLKKGATCPYCNELVIAKCGEINKWHWCHVNLEECDSWKGPETEWHLDWKGNFTEEQQEVIIEKCISEYCYNNKDGTGREHGIGHAPCNHKDCSDCVFVKHIADVRCTYGTVIEFQNSPLSPKSIREREEFYGNMVWVLNGETIAKNIYLKERDGYYSFGWDWFPKSWKGVTKPIYIDMQKKADEYWKKYLKAKDSLEELNQKPIPSSQEEETLYDDVEEFYSPDDRYVEIEWEMENQKKRYDLVNGKLFLIRKIYTEGKIGGWGKLVSKEGFIKEYGRYK